MFPKKIKPFIVLPLLLVLLFFSILLLSNFLLQKPSVQSYLIQRLSERIGFPIRTQKIELNLWHGIGIQIHGLEAESEQMAGKISASRARIVFEPGRLIKGDIVPVKVYVSRFKIEWDRKGEVSPLISGKGPPAKTLPLFWIPGLETISLDDGQVRIEGEPFSLEGFSLEIHQRRVANPMTMMVSSHGNLRFKGKKVPFGLRGSVSQHRERQENPFIDMTLEADRVPMAWVPRSDTIPFKKGDIKAKVEVKGHIGAALSANGRIRLDSTHFSVIDGHREKAYVLPTVTLDFKSVIKGAVIRFPSLSLKTEDLSLPITLTLDLNDRKNPYFHLDTKSPHLTLETSLKYLPTPLIPSWVEQTLLPLLKHGDIRLDQLSLEGRPNQFKNIHLPENRSLLDLRFVCENFRIMDDRVGQPIEKVSADVTLNEGVFQISRLKARFGKSTINRGNLKIHGVYSDRLMHRADLEGSFDLKELIRQLNIDLVPEDMRPRLDGSTPLSGNLDSKVTFLYQDGWDFPRIEKGAFQFREFSVGWEVLGTPLIFQEALFLVEEKTQNRFQGKGSWGNSTFQVKGDFDLAGKQFDVQQADVSADLDMLEVISPFYDVGDFPVSFNRPVSTHFIIKREIERWSCQGDLNLEGVVLETETISMDPPGGNDRIVFDIGLGPGDRMDMNKILVFLRESSLELSGSYDFEYQEFSRLKVAVPSFSLEDLGLRLKKMDIQARGNLGGHVVVKIDQENPLGTKVTGRMTGKDLLIHLGAIPTPIEDGHFKVDFLGNRITIPSLGMRLGKSTIKAGGDLTGWDGLRGKIWVASDFLDPGDLLPESETSDSEKWKTVIERLLIKERKSGPARFLDKLDIHLDLDILKGRFKEMDWGPLKAQLDFRGDKLYIRQSKIGLKHGAINLKGHLGRGERADMLFSSHIRLKDLPVENLIAGFGIKRADLEGALTMETILFMKGRDKKELISGMTGFSEILIEKGDIKKSGVLLNVLEFLSFRKIFRHIPKGIPKEGFYFESIQAHTAIDKGILKTENAIMKSPVINAVASGSLDLNENMADYSLGVQPLETLDTMVSKIPVLGYILTGKDKKFLTYYFRVKGPLNEKGPEVKYVPFKNLGKGTASALKRLFLTPIRIFKNLPKPGGPGAGPIHTDGVEEEESP